MSEGIDVKGMIAEAKNHFKLEMNYGKLTAVEKASIILSKVATICVLTIVGCFALFYITSLLLMMLVKLTGIVWVANLIIILILMLAMILIYAFRKQLIVDPITRFLTKLFLKPDDNE